MIKSLTSTEDGKLKVTYPNGETKNVPFLKDFRIGIKELDPLLVKNVTTRPRINDNLQSYFINFSGGLGDCLMLLEVYLSFRNFLKSRGFDFQFIILITPDRYTFFKSMFEMPECHVDLIVGEEATSEEIAALAKYPLVQLPSAIRDARVEHLSIGNFRDYTWAIWGIPGKYGDFQEQQFSNDLFKKLINLNIQLPADMRGENILVYPRGFGKANQWKTWSDDSWVEFCKLLVVGYSEAIIVFDATEALCLRLQDEKELKNRIKFYNHQSGDDIGKMSTFFSTAKAIISIDTGPAHFAGFFKIPCIVLWGPTNPIYYQHPNNINIRLSSCPPCFYSQRTELCNDNICMKVISPPTLLEIVATLL